MSYITSESVAQKRKQIKAAFPNFKFSVTRSHYSGISVDILSGPIDMGVDYQQVNPYYIKEHYANKPEVMNLLLGVQQIAALGKEVEVVDADYGSVPNFYVNISIGNWDKPYQIKK